MAIVKNKSDLFRDEGAGGRVLSSARVRGVTYTATGIIANLASDNNGSTYLMAEIPSHGILTAETGFEVGDWGFAAVRIGTATDPDALVSALTGDADSQEPIAKYDEPLELWELLGLDADPGGVIGLYATAIADATGGGSIRFEISWREK